MNISKELFEAVYNCNLSTDKEMNAFYIRHTEDNLGYINNFFFKCKEWANRLGYDLSTHSSFGKHYCDIHEMGQQEPEYCISENSLEQQAVFDACQWILTQVKEDITQS